MIPTPHISLNDKSKIAETVLMPGDPLRAKYIAETFLEDVEQFNTVRNMFGFTGTYKGKKISVMGSGMGMPSIGIYSYELFKFYDVKNIIRVGTAGSYSADLKLYDVFLARDAYSESTYAVTQDPEATMDIIAASETLNEKLIKSAKELNMPITIGRLHSSDVFYRKEEKKYLDISKKYDALAVEMESFALFHNARITGKNAACLVTISDNLITHEETTPEERQTAFENMMQIGLNVINQE